MKKNIFHRKIKKFKSWWNSRTEMDSIYDLSILSCIFAIISIFLVMLNMLEKFVK